MKLSIEKIAVLPLALLSMARSAVAQRVSILDSTPSFRELYQFILDCTFTSALTQSPLLSNHRADCVGLNMEANSVTLHALTQIIMVFGVVKPQFVLRPQIIKCTVTKTRRVVVGC
jgi:hypothetical protein